MTATKRLIPVVLVAGLATIVSAGIRSPGKYCGVVVYDRWDGCTLNSGVYLTYIAEAVKEKLRSHAGESVQINARKVIQPENPGDALISAFDYLGPAPAADVWPTGDGLLLRAASAFEDSETPVIAITLENVSRLKHSIQTSELAPTLLTRKTPGLVGRIAPDGPSYAVMTRIPFYGLGGPRVEGGVSAVGRSYTWRLAEPLPKDLPLGPGETRRIRIAFNLPEGEYDFLAGYGGGVHHGRGSASNLVAFDVGPGGKATAVKVQRR